MSKGEGFLTEGQREMMKIATENAENHISSSPKSPSALLSDQGLKAFGGGGGKVTAGGGNVGKQVRRTHSGKVVRVKKGLYSNLVVVIGINGR